MHLQGGLRVNFSDAEIVKLSREDAEKLVYEHWQRG